MTTSALPEVFRLEVSRDELTLIATQISGAASIELAARPCMTPVESVMVARAVALNNADTVKKFVAAHGINGMLLLVERLAMLGGDPFKQPLTIEE